MERKSNSEGCCELLCSAALSDQDSGYAGSCEVVSCWCCVSVASIVSFFVEVLDVLVCNARMLSAGVVQTGALCSGNVGVAVELLSHLTCVKLICCLRRVKLRDCGRVRSNVTADCLPVSRLLHSFAIRRFGGTVSSRMDSPLRNMLRRMPYSEALYV